MRTAVVLLLVIGVSVAQEMWISQIEHGKSAFHGNPDSYSVYRNVMDFGCAGDGIRDDTACINTAISSGGRCGANCGSSTITPALIYFPSGTYLVSSPIIMYYYSQLVGNANDRPTIVAAPGFSGAVFDANPYYPGGPETWFTNQNNFFRQVRNFVIDMTQINPATNEPTGIHWQVAQATSLVNIHIKMSTVAGNTQRGIFIENGSGGFMSDLLIEGGNYGAQLGNQQFLTRNLVFNNCRTAISILWNWQWTFKSITINNCGIGLHMATPPTDNGKNTGVGSILVLDSTISNTPVGIVAIDVQNPVQDTSGTLLLDNVRFENVPTAIQTPDGVTVLPGGTTTIASWGRGSFYNDESGTGSFRTGNLPGFQKSQVLLDNTGKFFERSRPQYEMSNVDDFVSVKTNGATGDGRTDDSDAIQAVINANVNGKIVYFPAGTYILAKTVFVPVGTRMIGETWSFLMAEGAAYNNPNQPTPMLRVGNPGDSGVVEITDFMFGSRGAQPGAVLVQWNVRESFQGSCGMWDSHFRVGGTQGSNLQVPQCPRGQSYNPACVGAAMLLHITASSSGYFENVWAWTADHDLDNHLEQGQVTIYVGRGVLIESTEGPVWLYGTQSEHNVFYQYQLSGAKNVFMTMLQGETPYWQPGPKAPEPFTPNLVLVDPSYGHCPANSATCAMSWGMRIVRSSDIYLYGAGLYNFFNNYDQTCVPLETCQDGMIELVGNTGVYMFNLNTKAAINQVMADNTRVLATQIDNRNDFCSTINAFLL